MVHVDFDDGNRKANLDSTIQHTPISLTLASNTYMFNIITLD